MVIIERMSDEKPKPIDDLKEGLGLLFRAAKGAVDQIHADKIEVAAKDAVKEVGRAFESIGNEVDKVFGKVTASGAPPAEAHAEPPADAAPAREEPKYDDGYAPEPPAGPGKGPRVG